MNKTLNNVWLILKANKTVRKSTNALATTLVGGMGVALTDGDITWAEVAVVLGTALVATSAVWKGTNQDDEEQE